MKVNRGVICSFWIHSKFCHGNLSQNTFNYRLVRSSQAFRELFRQGGYYPGIELMHSLDTLQALMTGHHWDLVISCYPCADIKISDVLQIIQDINRDLPVMLIVDPIHENVALDAMDADVKDYFFADNLKRLIHITRRELRESHKPAEQTLQASQQKYQALLENASDAIFFADLNGKILDNNRRAETMFGYKKGIFFHSKH